LNIPPTPVGESNQSECDATQPPESQQGASPVDTRRRFGIVALRHMTPGNPDGGPRQEWIDKKDGLPGEMVNDPTAQQRTDSGGNCGKPSPGPDGYAPLCLGERGTDDRKRAR